jgi:hypothetical protein
MARKHHKPEEVVGRPRQIEMLSEQGKPVTDAVRAIGQKCVPNQGDFCVIQGSRPPYGLTALPHSRSGPVCGTIVEL